MTDELNAKLDAIFDARSDKEAAAERLREEIAQQRKASLEEYLLLQESLIRPTLEVFVQKLAERGHKSSIYDFTDGEQIHGNTRSATIGIRFLLDRETTHRSTHEYPHLTMSVDKAGRKVNFSHSTMAPGRGGMAGGDGTVGYDELTPELINEKVLKVIAAVFK